MQVKPLWYCFRIMPAAYDIWFLHAKYCLQGVLHFVIIVHTVLCENARDYVIVWLAWLLAGINSMTFSLLTMDIYLYFLFSTHSTFGDNWSDIASVTAIKIYHVFFNYTINLILRVSFDFIQDNFTILIDRTLLICRFTKINNYYNN